MKLILDPQNVIGDCLASAFGLETYLDLLAEVSKPDFEATKEFRKAFNGFYKVRSRRAAWYDRYYSLLKEQKNSPRSYGALLRELYRCDGNNKVEVSFASKLIATVDPSKPIWDQYVLKNLGLNKDWERAREKEYEERIETAERIYAEIENRCGAFLRSPAGRQCIDLFDRVLPDYQDDISDIKKIDFFLWLKRDQKKKKAPHT